MARQEESSCPHNNAGCSASSLCADCDITAYREDDFVIVEHVANCQVEGFCAMCHLA